MSHGSEEQARDAQQLRELIALWSAASRAGDVDTVLSLMTDDVVFLLPGRAPMNKAEFAAASRAQSGGGASAMQIESEQDIREIQVAGDWAFVWTSLRVTVTPAGGAPPIRRAGHTLTVFSKRSGRWQLARDANLLAVVPN